MNHEISDLHTADGTGYCSTCKTRVNLDFIPGPNGSTTLACPRRHRHVNPPPIEDEPIEQKPVKKRGRPEAELQRQIIDALVLAGCQVWESSSIVRTPGVTRGIPDLHVRVPGLGHGLSIGLEVKTPVGVVSAHQQQSYEDGLIAGFVRSPADALRVVISRCDNRIPEDTKLRLRRVLEALV